MVAFAEKHVLPPHSDEKGFLACEVAAVAHAANLLDVKLFQTMLSSKIQKAWIAQSAHSFAVIHQCIKHSEKHQGENDHNNYLCLSDRIFEADLLDTVPFEGEDMT